MRVAWVLGVFVLIAVPGATPTTPAECIILWTGEIFRRVKDFVFYIQPAFYDGKYFYTYNIHNGGNINHVGLKPTPGNVAPFPSRPGVDPTDLGPEYPSASKPGGLQPTNVTPPSAKPGRVKPGRTRPTTPIPSFPKSTKQFVTQKPTVPYADEAFVFPDHSKRPTTITPKPITSKPSTPPIVHTTNTPSSEAPKPVTPKPTSPSAQQPSRKPTRKPCRKKTKKPATAKPTSKPVTVPVVSEKDSSKSPMTPSPLPTEESFVFPDHSKKPTTAPTPTTTTSETTTPPPTDEPIFFPQFENDSPDDFVLTRTGAVRPGKPFYNKSCGKCPPKKQCLCPGVHF